eukprot:7644621-Ditylum_brightwellii.AAC.1
MEAKGRDADKFHWRLLISLFEMNGPALVFFRPSIWRQHYFLISDPQPTSITKLLLLEKRTTNETDVKRRMGALGACWGCKERPRHMEGEYEAIV